MIILIGGTGFIGKHLCCLLHQKNIKAVSISPNPDLNFLAKLAPTIKGIKTGDLREPNLEKSLVAADTVVYLASQSIPGMQHNSINLEYELNIIPAITTLDYILGLNPSIKVIFASSGGTIYGPNHSKPIPESSIPNPITPYAYGKIAIENHIKYLSNTSDLSYTILRASNPVGKWHKNPKQGFIGAAIAKIKSGEPIQIFGSGETIRDYVDADELALAITMANDNNITSFNKTWNVGSGVPISLNQIINKLRSISKQNFDVTYVEARKTDLEYNVLNCTNIENQLGWSAQQTIDNIIEKAWNDLI